MIVLDTHIFIWICSQSKKVPKSIARALSSDDQWGISAISLWETAMLVSYKRIIVPKPLLEWFQIALKPSRMVLLPLTPAIAVRSGDLEMHGDPADRIIAATALEHGCRLATVDGKLTGLPFLNTVD